MRVLLIILFLFATHLHANVFQLSTIVDDQQLVPVIKINGKVVIEVKDVGSKQVFSSPFERSEKIFNTLCFLLTPVRLNTGGRMLSDLQCLAGVK